MEEPTLTLASPIPMAASLLPLAIMKDDPELDAPPEITEGSISPRRGTLGLFLLTI